MASGGHLAGGARGCKPRGGGTPAAFTHDACGEWGKLRCSCQGLHSSRGAAGAAERKNCGRGASNVCCMNTHHARLLNMGRDVLCEVKVLCGARNGVGLDTKLQTKRIFSFNEPVVQI